MEKGEVVERISVSLPKRILQILDDFCKENHGLNRSKGVVVAIKLLKEAKQK